MLMFLAYDHQNADQNAGINESGESVMLMAKTFEYRYSDSTSESFYPQFLRDRAEYLIKDIIRARDEEDIESLEKELYRLLQGQEQILVETVLDDTYLINVRAMAARLFLAKTAKSGKKIKQTTLDLLFRHPSPLIRLGVVLGLADACAWDAVRSFCDDAHSTVADEAKELLADAES
jgi:hypothetical protein